MILPYTVDEDWFYSRCLGWQLKFAWLPQRCHITNRVIWLEYAYKGTVRFRNGDITFDHEHRWHDKAEHLIWKLKGN